MFCRAMSHRNEKIDIAADGNAGERGIAFDLAIVRIG